MLRTLALTAALAVGGLVAAAFVLWRDDAATPEMPVPAPVMSEARQVFVSGHSLTAPLPPMIEALGGSRGRTVSVEAQLVDGSSIRRRLSAGADAVPPRGTDILLVTERHDVLDAIDLEGMVDELGRLVRRFREINPAGETFFYVPWANLSDRGAPAAWIRHERRMAPVWACAVRRAASLGGETGRGGIHLVPASLALADLVEALAREPSRFAGFEGLSQREVTGALFSDAVHPTPLGAFFLASLTDATLFGPPPAPAPPMAGLDPARAQSVRAFALRFADRWRQTGLGPLACPERVAPTVVLAYASYMAEAHGDPDAGFASRQLAKLRHAARLIGRLSF